MSVFGAAIATLGIKGAWDGRSALTRRGGIGRAVVAALTVVACGADPTSDEETGSDDSTTSGTPATTTTADDSGATEPVSTQTGPGTESGSDTGEPVPECPAGDDTISAQVSIAIDGMPVVVDYGGHFGGISGLPEVWDIGGGQPQIDGMCDVVEQLADALTLDCPDSGGVDRTLSLSLQTTESLSTDVGEGPVQVWYLAEFRRDMLETVSDTVAHSVVLSNDTGIVLAAIDGRFAFGTYAAGLDDAWPQWPQASISSNACEGPRDEAHFELETGETLDIVDGSIGDLGPYRVIVETATNVDEFDGEFDYAVPTARWVLGLPL